MIYSGLEFGQYFELERNTKCHNVLLALTPATRMAFIFIQMYFIFLNNEVGISRTLPDLIAPIAAFSGHDVRGAAIEPYLRLLAMRDTALCTIVLPGHVDQRGPH